MIKIKTTRTTSTLEVTLARCGQPSLILVKIEVFRVNKSDSGDFSLLLLPSPWHLAPFSSQYELEEINGPGRGLVPFVVKYSFSCKNTYKNELNRHRSRLKAWIGHRPIGKAPVVQWYDVSLPSKRPGFDSRLAHFFFIYFITLYLD